MALRRHSCGKATVKLKRWSLIGTLIPLILSGSVIIAQTLPTPKNSPRNVIEALWKMAARGDLLTQDGWKRAEDYYTVLIPWTGNKTVLIVSNEYGFDDASVRGTKANAVVTCEQLGQLDSALRYTPAPPSPYFKSGWGYDLVTVPGHMLFIGSNGRQEDKVNPKVTYWKIKGSQGMPWTTVNTAIRYVLEMRNKTFDPAIRKNADDTIAKLLKIH
jgi:hypothetical protein